MDHLMLLGQEIDGAGGLMAGGIFIVVAILGVLGFLVWLWALISAIKNPALDSTMRIVWILVIVLTGIIGAIIYAVAAPKSGTRAL